MRIIISIILIISVCGSCTTDQEENIIYNTIDLGLAEFLKKEDIVLINSGTIENGYFLKNLIKIKADSLRKNPKLNDELLEHFLKQHDSSYYVELSKLGHKGHLNFSHNESDIDSLLTSNARVYELGYSIPHANKTLALYYVELIDPSHRLMGKGVLIQFKNVNGDWVVESIVDGWEMRRDTVNYFSKFE